MITARECRAARVGLDLSRETLAKQAGIATRTLTDFERGARTPLTNNLKAIKAALEHFGVRFTDEGCICLPRETGEK